MVPASQTVSQQKASRRLEASFSGFAFLIAVVSAIFSVFFFLTGLLTGEEEMLGVGIGLAASSVVLGVFAEIAVTLKKIERKLDLREK